MLTDDIRTRSDLRLLGRAIREGWKIPPQILEVLPSQVVKIFVSGETSTREKLKAAEVLMKMHEQNLSMDRRPKKQVVPQQNNTVVIMEGNLGGAKSELARRIARLAGISDDSGGSRVDSAADSFIGDGSGE